MCQLELCAAIRAELATRFHFLTTFRTEIGRAHGSNWGLLSRHLVLLAPEDSFGSGQGTIIQRCLLHKAPDLSNEDWPEEEHGDYGRHGLLSEDTHIGIKEYAWLLGYQCDLQGGTHSKDCFEDITLRDADVYTATQ